MSINVSGGSLSWEAIIEDSKFNAKIRGMEDNLGRFDTRMQSSGEQMDTVFKRAATAAAGFFSLQAGVGLINQIKNVRSEYQQLEASYATILGSKQKADALMAETIKFAATTPFGLSEVAQGTKLLLAYGLSAQEASSSLRSIGDIAASINQPINELAMVYGQIRTQGRLYTEDLNQLTGRGVPIIKALADQFHVAEDRVKGMVEAGRVGFPEIQKAFTSMTTGAGMFTGAMEAQSKTLAGQISNLEDALDQVYNKIGKENEQAFSAAIRSANDLVDNYEVLLNALEAIVVGYTAYKAAAVIDFAYTNVAARVASVVAEKDAVTALAVERSRSAAQELITATQLKVAAVEKYRTDAAALIIAQEKLAMAEAENVAAQGNIYSQTRLTAAKEVQIATDRVNAAQETTAISRKAALTATTTLHARQLAAETLAKEAGALATTELTAAEALATAGTNLLSGAWARLSAFMAANPFLLVAAAAAGLYYTFKTLNDEQEKLSLITEGYIGELESERSKLKETTEYAKRLTAGTKERKDAIKEINDKYGSYLANLLSEAASNKDIADAYQLVNQKIRENIDLKFQQKNQDKAKSNLDERADPAYDSLITDIRASKGVTGVAQARTEIDGILDRLTLLNDKRRELIDQGKDVASITTEILSITTGFYKKFNINQGLFDNKFGQLGDIAAARSDYNKFLADSKKMFGSASVPAEEGKTAPPPSPHDAAYYDKIIKDTKGAIEGLDKLDKDFAKKKAALDKVLIQAQKDRKAFDTGSFDNQLKADNEALKKRQDLYSQFGQLHQDYLQNQKTADQKEIDQTVYKYDQLLKKAAEYNATHKVKVNPAALNLDPNGNIVDKPVAGGTTLDINAEKNKAKADVEAKEQLEKNKVQYEAQKELYAQYEDFKTKFGSKAADERYAKELKGATSYVQFLENLERDNKGQVGSYASALTDFLSKELPKARIDAAKENFAFLNSVLADTQTYEQKLAVLKQNYEKAALTASLNGNEENVIIAKESYEQQVDGLNESHQQRLRLINGFNQNVVELTRQQALSQIGALKQLLAGANSLTDKQRGEVADKVTQLENALGTKNGLKNLPLNQLKDNVQQLKKELDDLKNSGGSFDALKQKAEELAKAQDAVNDETKKLDELPIDKLNAAGEAMNSLSSNLNGISPELAQIISGLGGFAIQLANVIELSKKMGSEGASFSDYANAVASGASFLANTIGSIVSASKARKEAEQAYYNAVISQQNQYNISLNEEIRLRSQLKESVFSKDYAGRILDGSKALVDANAKFNKSLADLQKGQAKIGQRDKVDVAGTVMSTLKGAGTGAAIGALFTPVGAIIGGAIGAVVGLVSGLFSKKKKDVFGGLLTEFPELIGKAADGTAIFNKELAQSLIANNLVDDATKVMLQNTIDLAEQRAKAIEQINGVISDLAGSLGDDLRNALVNAAKDGTDAFDAFGDSVSKVIENIISQMLFQEVFGDQLKALEDEMKGSYAAGGDQNFVDDIARFYENAGPLIEQFNAGLKAANEEGKKNGLNVFEKGGNKSSLDGAVKRELTETTGSAIEGLMRSQQQYAAQTFKINQEQLELWKGQAALSQKHFDIANRNLETAIKIEANTLRTADNTDALSDIKRSLESMDKKMSSTTPGTGFTKGLGGI